MDTAPRLPPAADVLLDDGWPLCAQHSDNGSCARIPPRDAGALRRGPAAPIADVDGVLCGAAARPLGLQRLCRMPHARVAADGRIVVDPLKFPNGFQPVTSYVHSLGLKIGIYTSVSHTTCGGFPGSASRGGRLSAASGSS